MLESNGGTISADGLYQPPDTAATPAVFHVQAISVADPAQVSTTTVTIPPIAISPTTATVMEGAQQQFSASVRDVLWSLENVTPAQEFPGGIRNGTYSCLVDHPSLFSNACICEPGQVHRCRAGHAFCSRATPSGVAIGQNDTYPTSPSTWPSV